MQGVSQKLTLCGKLEGKEFDNRLEKGKDWWKEYGRKMGYL